MCEINTNFMLVPVIFRNVNIFLQNVVETDNEKNVFPGKKKCITHENDCMLVGFRSAYEMIAYHN
jgi:hypothetical protein